jgi:hypothetical protein
MMETEQQVHKKGCPDSGETRSWGSLLQVRTTRNVREMFRAIE